MRDKLKVLFCFLLEQKHVQPSRLLFWPALCHFVHSGLFSLGGAGLTPLQLTQAVARDCTRLGKSLVT